MKKTPVALEERACRLIANKCTLAARIDNSHSADLNVCYNVLYSVLLLQGESGRRLRGEIERKLEKLQEPPPPRKEKPLPKPDDVPKYVTTLICTLIFFRKRRGGARMRKMKERYAMTELHKRGMPTDIAEK